MMTALIDFLNDANRVGFYALAAVAVFASFRVVTHANPVHAILSMIVSLLSVAGIFFILGAPFAGVLEIIVYAGAILVLFVFVIMMLNLGSDVREESSWLTSSAWAVPVCLTLIIAGVLVGVLSGASDQMLSVQTVDAKAVGVSLFTQYALLVVVAAFLLLGALVAAYHLGKKALDDENFSHYQDSEAGQLAANNQPDKPVFSDCNQQNRNQQGGL